MMKFTAGATIRISALTTNQYHVRTGRHVGARRLLEEREMYPHAALVCGPAADCGRRRTEGTGDVILVREVARGETDGPRTEPRSELRADVEQAVRELPLNRVVERREEHGTLPRRVRAEGERVGSSDAAAPFRPDAARPLRRVVETMPRDV